MLIVRRRSRAPLAGFTLIELLLTLSLAALVVTVGVPSFQNLIANNRLAGATNTLLAALNLSRSEAVKRGQRVTLCASGDGLSCAGDADYSGGWLVFSDPDGNAAVDAAGDVLRVFKPDTARVSIEAVDGDLGGAISYDPDGITRRADGTSQTGRLALCQSAPPRGRCIVISRSGRPQRADAECLC